VWRHGPARTERRLGLSFAGEFGFQRNCASCHVPAGQGGADNRAPTIETLRQFTPERVYDALTKGKMQAQASALPDQLKRDIAEWVSARSLGAAEAGDAKTMPNRCASPKPLNPALANWNGWGASEGRNTRFQPAKAAGLSAQDLPRLKLKWAFGIPNGVQTFSQPTVFGGRVFFGSDSGQVYAVDADSGCVRWSFLADAAVRSAPVAARTGGAKGPYAVYFGDMKSNVYAVDALSGRLIWKAAADRQPLTRITASVAVYDGRVYVPTGSSEENSARQANYECCRNRGSVVAMNARTGAMLWKTYMLPEPQPIAVEGATGRRWGPAGASIWSTPTIDAKRGRLYVATGDAFSGSAGKLTDAVIALDMAKGKVVWSYQDTADDVWVAGCSPGVAGCGAKVGPDWDYGSSAALQTRADGRDVVVAAHKGGTAVALDPDHGGALLWRIILAAKPPSAEGEIVFGGAVDRTSAYFAQQKTGGLAAVDLKTGARRWFVPVAVAEGRKVSVGSSAAVTAIPGVVFSGSWDGLLRAHASDDGRVLWSFDTMKPFDTVNKVPAKGGSMAAPGATVAGGMLFVGSGYIGVSNGVAGNVMLAFSAR
jgi:polyvinyl alcohol dehydrogenase (cytochrome)